MYAVSRPPSASSRASASSICCLADAPEKGRCAACTDRERSGCRQACLYIGDDDTDEIAFERAPPHWMTVRIDPAGTTAARYCLEEQASIEILLAYLLAEHADRNGIR